MTKLSRAIAEQMIELIAAAGWPVGTVIATEAELKERLKASRAVIREAIGLIELRGIAVMKPGKGGGLMVTAPAWHANVMAVATFLEVADARLEDMLGVMARLESLAVELTIDRIDERSAAELADAARLMKAPPRALETELAAFRDYRNMLARLSGNPVLALWVAGFQIALSGLSMARLFEPGRFEPHLERSKAIKADVLDAILACERFPAEAAVRADAENQLASLRRSRIATMSRINEDAERGGMKLPRWIALQISRRIAENSMGEGDMIGSESELMAQFSVGRSVLREAIRMLEAYSVVAMRRGPGGGLRVGSPDPEPTARSVADHLRAMPQSAAHAFEVRAALEIEAVGLAARRCDAAGAAALHQYLSDAIDGGQAASGAGISSLASFWHAIAESSGDKVLAFISASMRQVMPHRIDKSALGEALSLCRPIVDAVARGDVGAARRLMHEHLRTLRPHFLEASTPAA